MKVGNPDGGVECYITLENGNEVGFQAKWFMSSLQETQWNQIEKSLKTALEKHPNLITYYVAIPLDRADPRKDNQEWFMDKWHKKVKKWNEFSNKTYSKDIEIRFWGSSELIARLAKDKNSGLKKFFFNEIDLSNKWFRRHTQSSINALEKRYTPEINVELDILENFNALSRNDTFKIKLDDLYHNMVVQYKEIFKYQKNKHLYIDVLVTQLSKIEELYTSIIFDGIREIDFNSLSISVTAIQNDTSELLSYLEDLNQKEIEAKKISTSHHYRPATRYDRTIRDFINTLESLNEFQKYLESQTVKLVNNPYMLLTGDAGIGKSHLLADVITQRAENHQHSLFFLGQQFRQDKAPWAQILDDLLHIDTSIDDFLGALSAKAEAQNERIVIFIDAINEGKGKDFWYEFLITFIESIKEYKWLGLVLSIRSSYYKLMIPETVTEHEVLIEVEHYGFEGVEYNASKIFFKNYEIEQPAVPLLHPEFSNPLFLKLFCEGLHNRKLTKMPDGYEGISNIIDFFVQGIETKLSRVYPSLKDLKVLDMIIDALIAETLKQQNISYAIAYRIVEDIASEYRYDRGMLDDLISEGLLSKNIVYNHATDSYDDVIYFAYERFEDHLKVKYLFQNHLNFNNPKESFSNEPFATYFTSENGWYYFGLIEAMSIQLPELCNVELIDMLPQDGTLHNAFFESLKWRKTESITENVKQRILKNIANETFQQDIFEVLFSTASSPAHPLNASFLHQYLKSFSMKDRDVWMIPLLNDIYLNHEVNPIKRLIDWAWSNEDKSYISDESIFLMASVLAWLLVTSNRELRDYATKALVSILQERHHISLKLLKAFEDIDEPYIYERLFAVTFGSVARSKTDNGLNALGIYIYKTIFDKDEVYPHILLRDYAKSTIDYIHSKGVKLEIEYEKVEPPYTSVLPSLDKLPHNENLQKYKDKDKNYHNSHIISSMLTEYGGGTGGYGDFGRYVFGSALNDFECKKDEQLFSNYATVKIFDEYGYDAEFFDKSEQAIQTINRYSYDRHKHNIERIGKKYQWLAFYDTLARVTDHYKMYDSGSWDNNRNEIPYQGSFEPYIRDIDPTVLLKETMPNIHINKKSWWQVNSNFMWNMENRLWLNDTNDLVNPKNCVHFTDDNSCEWIALSNHVHWKEPLKKGTNDSDTIHKEAWYILQSYLIPTTQTKEFEKWAEKQHFWNDWMPSAKDHYQLFNREFYWSQTYKYLQSPYYGYPDWTHIDIYSSNGKYPHKVGLTDSRYYWEEEFDCSKDTTLSISQPSKILYDGLHMQYSNKDGVFIDHNGEIICFDPSVYTKTNQCVLVKKLELERFLLDHKLSLCWTIIGEKQVFTPMHSNDDSLGVMQLNGYMNINGFGKLNIKKALDEYKNYSFYIDIQKIKQ